VYTGEGPILRPFNVLRYGNLLKHGMVSKLALLLHKVEESFSFFHPFLSFSLHNSKLNRYGVLHRGISQGGGC
jgi:hypothetical protein